LVINTKSIHEARSEKHQIMFTRVWQQLEYRIDVCRVTRGAHIEYL